MKKSIVNSLVAIGLIVACARVRAEDTGAGKTNPAVTPASRDEKWKKETMLVSPEGDQTVVRSCADRKILFQNADPQLAIEWGLANARTTVVLAGKYVISDRVDIPRDDVTLIIDKDAEIAVSPDITRHTYIGFRPEGSWKRLCVIYNRGHANVRVIIFGTIPEWIVRPTENGWTGQNPSGTPYRATWPVYFDGRNPEYNCGVKGGMLLATGSIAESLWLVDCSDVEVPIMVPRFGGDSLLNMEGCEDCKLGMLVNLATTPGGKTGETLDLNGRNKGITIERAIGERPFEVIDNNSSHAIAGEIVSIGKTERLFRFVGQMDGARYTSRPHPGPTAMNIEKETVLEDAVNAALHVDVPNLPDDLPRFTVKATVTVTLKDGSKKAYTKQVAIDVREDENRAKSAAAQGHLQEAKAKPDQAQTNAAVDGMAATRTLDLGGGVTMELMLIRPGSFMMGSDNKLDRWVEKPVRKVTISKPFYMAKYEVTQEQWEALMGSNPSH
ncbi:MAG: SUMF1/EgtB/PvdO family nonheme iron enzyme, partial [Chloroflexi bacterium]|nr:SUMF1/EgtB/PvdO family nonheme iron enzyme [Chloroflexota bacterium]